MDAPPSTRGDAALNFREIARRHGLLLSASIVAGPTAAALFAGALPPPPEDPWSWLLLLAIAPLAEEFVFRGAMQPALHRHDWGRGSLLSGQLTTANVLTSVLFAVCHVPAAGLAVGLMTFAPSLVFGWLRERSGGIAIPIAMHAYYNACYLLLGKA